MTAPSLNESELINMFCRGAPTTVPDLLLGVGDDAAAISGPGESCWVLACDACVEDVHFRRSWGLAHAGYKALARNVSDVSAMGAQARFALQGISFPRDIVADEAAAIQSGLSECAAEFNVQVIGGDISKSPSGISLSVTVIGSAPRGRILRRSGARADDVLYVTGTLGEAALGWHCLERDVCEPSAEPWIARQLRPRPQQSLGTWLVETGCVSSMIDVSDGLVCDVSRLADASGCGFEISMAALPARSEFFSFAGGMGIDPFQLMLSGGEDYELAFTVSSASVSRFELMISQAPGRITRIGSMLEDVHQRVVLDERGQVFAGNQSGFDHFRSGACWE